MARPRNERHEAVTKFVGESRWWGKVSVLCAVLGAVGVGVGVPLSLIEGQQYVGIPMTLVGVVFLIAVWRSGESSDGHLKQSFEIFDTDTRGRPQPIP